ncbi:right-handed parallel beta-helix repeat-containing protein [Bacillus sp. sid0103]|uniref:right-handed parallel beta-helix repeat-containing protein n=1 Tax=Bacillus sp. sid0103 TaxID=2856337 RepID=UPI001C45F441|nr:right-handed parallel beta-helix repeat-containing protein [Bacillus sp. sid0103]MBV7503645.1 right-handed parallel beta-helix repeat-containing protein [Bacillus sp. sid0103]
MATNKTDFLKLNDWVGTDPFRPEELNANFRTLDAKAKDHNDRIDGLSVTLQDVDGKVDKVSADLTGKADKSEVTNLTTQLAGVAIKLDTKEINVLAPPAPFVAAKGDGVTNDSAAIQNIIDSLSNKGMRLYFPLGTYLIGNQLNLVSKLHLIGAKGAVFKLGTTSGMVDITSRSDIVFENIIFDGNNLALTIELLGFFTSNNIVLDKCTFRNVKHHAIVSYETSLLMRDCVLTDITKEAIRLDSTKPATIERTTITNATNAGIEVANGGSVKYVSNIFRHNVISNITSTGGTGENGNGIVVDKVNGALITHNVISQTARSGIRLNNSGDTVVSSNRVNNAGDWAIYAEFGGNNVVISDNLILDSNGGISCTNSNVGGKVMTVSGNILRNITDTAIDIEDSTVVTCNNIDGAVWGIRMGWGAYGKKLIVTSNIIADTRTIPLLKVGIVVNKNVLNTDFIIAQNIIRNFINYGICGADLSVSPILTNTPAFAITANNIPAPY